MRLRPKMPWKYTISWATKFICSLPNELILKKTVLPFQRGLKGDAGLFTSGQKNHRMIRNDECESRNQGKTVANEISIEERIKEENKIREKIDEKGNKWRKLYPVRNDAQLPGSQKMSNDFEKTVNELQESIMEEARKVYSGKVIERWLNPRNLGKIRKPDGFSKIKGPCGDTMQISFKVKDHKISKIRFMTDGCASSIAAGSMATELALRKKVEEAAEISQQMILDALDGLPEESVHCALLASNTLKEAIKNYNHTKRDHPDPQGKED
jgi:nitrogen fixation NifU-like protein